MFIPNPILFGPTPPGGAVLAVTSERGGLSGYVVLGQAGPTATVELNTGETWAPIRYPHTLGAGEQLRLTRSSTLPTLTTLHMLAPVDEGEGAWPPSGEGFTVLEDEDGYQTIEGAEIEADEQGYQTIINGMVVDINVDGYETVERS